MEDAEMMSNCAISAAAVVNAAYAAPKPAPTPVPQSDVKPKGGRLILIIGCMFSGKTDSMTDIMHRYQISGKKCIIFKHNFDTRYEAKAQGIVCNNGVEKNHVAVMTTDSLVAIESVIKEYDVIGISEIQFFKGLTILDAWANQGKIIVCEGLAGTSDRSLFGEVYQLLPLCDQIHYKRAVCLGCGRKASYSARITKNTDTISIGGIESYHPLCRDCFNAK